MQELIQQIIQHPYLQYFIQHSYIQSLVIFVTFFLISKLIIKISETYIRKLTESTTTNVDDSILDEASRPISYLILLFGIRLAILPLGKFIIPYVLNIILNIISTLIILITTLLVIRVFRIIIDSWGRKWAARTKSKIDDQLIYLLHRFSRILFSILGLLVILDTWGIQVAPLLASLGIAGIAIAFALQSTLGNIFGGISLIIDKTIKVGDVIKLDDGTLGTVTDVGLRSTKIQSFNNEVFIIPNGKLADGKIQNYVLPEPTARLELPFGVAYGSNIEKVKKIVTKAVKDIEGVLDEPPITVRFLEMANSSLNFKAFIWCDSYSNRFAIRDEANTRVYNALNKAKINIPFPQMEVKIKKR